MWREASRSHKKKHGVHRALRHHQTMAALESSASRGGGAGCRAALRALPEAWRRSELLWEALFASPCEWWDFRRGKTSRGHPDFRHKASRDSLWLDNQYKPAWVDPRLPTLEHLTTPAPCAALLCDEFYTLLGQGHLDKALHLLPRMDQLHMAPSQGMYMSLLKACNRSRALPQAKLIHSHISSRRLQLTGLLGDFLVVTLAKCGALEDARQLFRTLPCGTVFSWTAMISGYVDCGKDQEALKMYSIMLEEGVEPDRCTFVSLFKACGNILDLGEGKRLHAEAQSKGFISDIFVASSLVSMYGKCGDIVQAEVVFDGMCQRDVVAWSGMLSAYIDEGQGNKALRLYRQMHEEGMRLYRLPFVSAVQACGILAEEEKASVMQGTSAKAKSLEIAQALHADARREGITSDVFVGSTLMSFYGKLGAIVEAEIACDGLSERDVVAWSAMLSAYVEQCQGDKALQLYRHMQQEGVSPNKLTFVFALQACGILADKEEAFMVEGCSIKVVSLEIGQALHVDAERKGFASDIVVGSMLVSMYGKCGAVVEAEIAFNELSERDTVSWTAMLSAYVNEGLGDKALQFYTQMQKEHITLTDITLVSVLQACSGSGSLEIVRQLHFSTVSSWYDVSRLLVNTLVYAYGTCASMVEAQAVFDGLPQPDVVTWSACIAGYSQEGNCALCLKMFRKMQLAGIKPDGVTFLSLLSAFRHAGLVHEAVDNFESMRRDYGLIPALKHYAVMIDLLGRAGNLKGVERILRGMPKQADLSILLGLLGACRTHGNLEMGKQAFGHAVHLQPMEATAYVLMSNLYADAGMQDGANEEEKLRQGEGA